MSLFTAPARDTSLTYTGRHVDVDGIRWISVRAWVNPVDPHGGGIRGSLPTTGSYAEGWIPREHWTFFAHRPMPNGLTTLPTYITGQSGRAVWGKLTYLGQSYRYGPAAVTVEDMAHHLATEAIRLARQRHHKVATTYRY